MMILWYFGVIVCLFLAAFVAALIGIGGGVLYTPIQIFFDVGIHEAATTSLFLIMILSIGATIIYRRARKIDWMMAVVLEIFTTSGAFAGGYLSEAIPAPILTSILIATLVMTGLIMIRGSVGDAHLYRGDAWYLWRRESPGGNYTINMLLAIPISSIAGAMSGMIGIGGGVLKVPMMAILFGVPIDIAIATSAFMVGITAAAGFAGHLVAGHWEWRYSLLFAPAVFLGATLGAGCMLRIDKRKLKKIFGVFVLLFAMGLVFKLLY